MNIPVTTKENEQSTVRHYTEQPATPIIIALDCGCIALACSSDAPLLSKLNGLIIRAARNCDTLHFTDNPELIALRPLLEAAFKYQELRKVLQEAVSEK